MRGWFFLLGFAILVVPLFSDQNKSDKDDSRARLILEKKLEKAEWFSLDRYSLEKKLEEVTDWKDRLTLIHLLVNRLTHYDLKEAEMWLIEAKNILDAKDINEEGFIDNLNMRGLLQQRFGNLKASKGYYESALSRAKKKKYLNAETEAYVGISTCYQQRGQLDKALVSLLRCREPLEILEKKPGPLSIKLTRALADCYYGLGVINFYYPNTYPQALKYFQKSLGLRGKRGHFDDKGVSLYWIGETLQNLGKYAEAYGYYNDALENGLKTRNPFLEASADKGKADIFMKRDKDYEKALELYKQSEKRFMEIGVLYQLAAIKRDIGICLKELGRVDEAEEVLSMSLRLADNYGYSTIIRDVAKHLESISQFKGDNEQQENFSKLYMANQKYLAENSMWYGFYRKWLVQHSKDIQGLMYWGLLPAFAFIAIILFLFKKTRWINRELEVSNAQLEEQKQKVEQSLQVLEMLNTIGKEIISSLSIDDIINRVYEHVNSIMDATVFAIGIFKPEQNAMDFLSKEEGENLPPYSFSVSETNRMAILCFKEQKMIKTSDYGAEYSYFLEKKPKPKVGQFFSSHIFLPLTFSPKNGISRKIGVITVQSPAMNAYDDKHVMIFRNIANYAAIALNNANTLKKLKDVMERERELGMLKDQFMYTLSHQYKTPLTSIDLSAQNLCRYLDRMDKQEVDGELEVITRNAERMKQLIDDLMKLGREFKPAVQDLDALCRRVVGEFAGKSTREQRIEYHSKDEPVEVFIDKELVEISLGNLLGNAMKYSGEGTEITVTLEEKAGLAVITVEDQGPGIPGEILKLKDKRFHRGSNARDTDGNGLGLSIVERHTRLLGGTVHYESRSNEGTTVKVSLPVKARTT